MKKQIVKRVPPETAPPEKEIVFCISLYFGIPKKFSRQNIFFKLHLHEIVRKRDFLETIEDQLEKEIFNIYLTTRTPKVEISKMTTSKSHWGESIINRNLKRLVSEIMIEYNSGILQVQEYVKPRTKTEDIKRINQFYENRGIDKRLPLRESSLREIVSARNKKNQLLP